jgi:hypothetical protein
VVNSLSSCPAYNEEVYRGCYDVLAVMQPRFPIRGGWSSTMAARIAPGDVALLRGGSLCRAPAGHPRNLGYGAVVYTV